MDDWWDVDENGRPRRRPAHRQPHRHRRRARPSSSASTWRGASWTSPSRNSPAATGEAPRPAGPAATASPQVRRRGRRRRGRRRPTRQAQAQGRTHRQPARRRHLAKPEVQATLPQRRRRQWWRSISVRPPPTPGSELKATTRLSRCSRRHRIAKPHPGSNASNFRPIKVRPDPLAPFARRRHDAHPRLLAQRINRPISRRQPPRDHLAPPPDHERKRLDAFLTAHGPAAHITAIPSSRPTSHSTSPAPTPGMSTVTTATTSVLARSSAVSTPRNGPSPVLVRHLRPEPLPARRPLVPRRRDQQRRPAPREPIRQPIEDRPPAQHQPRLRPAHARPRAPPRAPLTSPKTTTTTTTIVDPCPHRPASRATPTSAHRPFPHWAIEIEYGPRHTAGETI